MKMVIRATMVATLLLLVLVSAANLEYSFAQTVLNATYKVGATADRNTLTLTGANNAATPPAPTEFTIAASAKITVYDSDCKKLDPQPEMTVSPNLGTTATKTTIKTPGGSFPAKGKVVISSITTTQDKPKPKGEFSKE